jgi:hypothetical protein
MQFVDNPENTKLSNIGTGLQYQYNQCGSFIFRKNAYPELFNEQNNLYYEDAPNEDSENKKSREFKDIITINGKSGKVSTLCGEYLILVPCSDHSSLLSCWEKARIKTILKYGSFTK